MDFHIYEGSADSNIFRTVVLPGPQGPISPLLLGNILPETRWQVSVTTTLTPNIDAALQWIGDQDYGTGDGGTGRFSNFITARISANF